MIGTNFLRISRRIKKHEAGNAHPPLRPKTEPTNKNIIIIIIIIINKKMATKI